MCVKFVRSLRLLAITAVLSIFRVYYGRRNWDDCNGTSANRSVWPRNNKNNVQLFRNTAQCCWANPLCVYLIWSVVFNWLLRIWISYASKKNWMLITITITHTCTHSHEKKIRHTQETQSKLMIWLVLSLSSVTVTVRRQALSHSSAFITSITLRLLLCIFLLLFPPFGLRCILSLCLMYLATRFVRSVKCSDYTDCIYNTIVIR